MIFYEKKVLLILAIILLSSSSFCIAFASSINDDKELDWYFVPRVIGAAPEPAKESVGFLHDSGGYYIGNTNTKELFLTFDEGYERGNTNNILDTLKELDIPAAFFVVKPFLDTEPDLIKRMVNEGHLVCNHSNHHPSMPSITDSEKFKKEFTDVEEAYTKITGEDMPKFFRPPMGKYSKNSLLQTKELGYKTVFWSFAYRDWLINEQPDENAAIAKIKKGAHPGGILLLHAVSDTNTKILKTVLQDLKNEGYEFKSLNELSE